MDLIKLAQESIAIDSCFQQGTKDFISFAQKLCQKAGLETKVHERVIGSISYQSLVAQPSGIQCSEDVVFQAHIDTLDPGLYSDWTETDHNPFKASISGDKIYGLGSASAKLDFLCKLMAIVNSKSNKFKKSPTLVASYGAEEGFVGTQELLQAKWIRPMCAIVGEPSNLRPITSSCGKAIVDIFIPYSESEIDLRHRRREEITSTQTKIFRGKTTHSSTPHLGSSAFESLIKYLKQLPESVMVVGLEAGVSHSTVPSDAVLELDLTAYPQDQMHRKLIDVIKKLEELANNDFGAYLVDNFSEQVPSYTVGKVRTEDNGFRILVSYFLPPSLSLDEFNVWLEKLRTPESEHKIKYFFAPCSISEDNELVRQTAEILSVRGKNEKPIAKTKMTEASFYQDRGIAAIALGPGELYGNSFSANEYNKISELELAIDVYQSMIQRLCL